MIRPEQMPYTNPMGQTYDAAASSGSWSRRLRWPTGTALPRARRSRARAGGARPRHRHLPGMDGRQRVRGARHRGRHARRLHRGLLGHAGRWGRASPPRWRSWRWTPSTCRSSACASCRATPTAATASAAPARARCSPAARRCARAPSARWRRRGSWRPRAGGRARRHRVRGGRFHVAGTDHGIDLFELAGRQAEGSTSSSTAHARVSGPTWPNGCHICEVELDPGTGAVEIVAYASVNDIGRVVNPLIVRGQLDGGAVQGIGQALCEQHGLRPDSGQLLTGQLDGLRAAARRHRAPLQDRVRQSRFPA
jgi:hypothetical protein